ncbi:CRISPR-associated protein Cas5 [Aurantiacibacter rhizosphaerae]|uniref:CRISPR-associated protein Cas5 n=1 Tax=Aurantiacibacter rhizosphaerae TaxID=2691582 RepID=A0A844XB73_9SPHN|nr:CRISPR-associated protein Cas5 [Aurantiacibacter rhizosphaerae]
MPPHNPRQAWPQPAAYARPETGQERCGYPYPPRVTAEWLIRGCAGPCRVRHRLR